MASKTTRAGLGLRPPPGLRTKDCSGSRSRLAGISGSTRLQNASVTSHDLAPIHPHSARTKAVLSVNYGHVLSEQDQALLHSIAAATNQSDEAVASAALTNYVQWQAEYIWRVKAGMQAAQAGDVMEADEVDALFAELDRRDGLSS